MKLSSAPESMRACRGRESFSQRRQEGTEITDEPGLLTLKDRKRGNVGFGHNKCTVSDLYSSDVTWGAALPFPAAWVPLGQQRELRSWPRRSTGTGGLPGQQREPNYGV